MTAYKKYLNETIKFEVPEDIETYLPMMVRTAMLKPEGETILKKVINDLRAGNDKHALALINGVRARSFDRLEKERSVAMRKQELREIGNLIFTGDIERVLKIAQ